MSHNRGARIRHFLNMLRNTTSMPIEYRTDRAFCLNDSMNRFSFQNSIRRVFIAAYGGLENNSLLLVHSLIKQIYHLLDVVFIWFGCGWNGDTTNWMWAQ